MAILLKDTEKAECLFDGWQETLIWSCLQNIMGAIYADNSERPESAVAVLGDFCFTAGRPDMDLLNIITGSCNTLLETEDETQCCNKDFVIMVPQNTEWAELIKSNYGSKAKEVTRYAIKKSTEFNKRQLIQAVNSLESEYELRLIDKECYDKCIEDDWSRDLVSQFTDYETYSKLGIGVVILRDGRLVSGASSYARYREGIEIEIDTHKEYRRKGLAYICGAKLILECIDRGLYPSWDAQNTWSVALAEKLGYRYDHSYLAYEVRVCQLD